MIAIEAPGRVLMETPGACPNCQSSLTPNIQICPSCGVHLAEYVRTFGSSPVAGQSSVPIRPQGAEVAGVVNDSRRQLVRHLGIVLAVGVVLASLITVGSLLRARALEEQRQQLAAVFFT